MIGRPLSARDWNHHLRTDRGERICAFLMPFHEVPLRLGPPASDVPGLGRALARFEIGAPALVSVGAFQAAIDALPEGMRRGAAAGFASGQIEATDRPLSDVLERKFERSPWPDKAYDLVHGSIVGTLTEHLDRDYRGFTSTALRQTLAHVLTYATAFLAEGRDDLASTVVPFADLFRLGNFPVAKLRDGRLLVLAE